MVSLASTPLGNPVVLSEGETITVDVFVSGIGLPGNPTSLNALGVTVLFDSISLGAPFTSSFGPIFPLPVDAPDGILTIGPDSAIGLYDVTLPDGGVDGPIITDGLFFTFTLTALSVPLLTDSMVTISDASYFDQNDNFLDADRGDPISVQVAAAAIPEPASWLIFALGALGLARARRR